MTIDTKNKRKMPALVSAGIFRLDLRSHFKMIELLIYSHSIIQSFNH